MKVIELITEVSKYLRDQRDDHEFEAWEEDDLKTYLRLALVKLYAVNKELFSVTKKIELDEDTLQTLDDGEELFYISKLTLSGVVYTNPREVNPTMSRHFLGIGGCPSEYTFSRGPSLSQFELNVIPSLGDTAVVRIARIPELEDNEDVPGGTKYHAYLFNAMVSYAYGRDSTSQYFNARSDVFYNKADKELKDVIGRGVK